MSRAITTKFFNQRYRLDVLCLITDHVNLNIRKHHAHNVFQNTTSFRMAQKMHAISPVLSGLKNISLSEDYFESM